jgi:uncharacterized membrane protein YqgA involved in biofilm formation
MSFLEFWSHNLLIPPFLKHILLVSLVNSAVESDCQSGLSEALNVLLTLSVVDGMGRMILAGGAAVGLGALCYYGLGMSNEIGAIEKAV